MILFRGRMPDLVVTYVTPNVTAILGYAPEQIVGVPGWWLANAHPEDRATLALQAAEGRQRGEPQFEQEHRIRGSDGAYRWFHTVVRYERDERGQPVGFLGTALDVTAGRETRERLREAEARYRTLVEQLPAITYVDEIDPRTGIVRPIYVSPRVETMLGYAPAEWLVDPTVWRAWVHPEDRQRIDAEFDRARQTQEPLDAEYRMLARDGRVVWFHDVMTGRPGERRDGLRYQQGVMLDITERKLLEERLQRQNAELMALHETALGLLERRDADELIEAAVVRAGELLGTPDGFLFLVEPESGTMVARVGTGVFAGQLGNRRRPGEGLAGAVWERGEPVAVDDYARWDERMPDLETLRLHAVAGVPLRVAGEVVGVIGVAFSEEGRTFGPEELALLDRFGRLASLALGNARLYTAAQQELEQRAAAEAALGEAEAKYRTLVEGVPAIVYSDLADASSTSLYMSPQIQAILGYAPEEFQADPQLWARLVHPDDHDRIVAGWQADHARGGPYASEYRLVARDGRVVWVRDVGRVEVDVEGRPHIARGVMVDITERRELETRLQRQNEELVALHEVALGLIEQHEPSALLDAILSHAGQLAGTPHAYLYLVQPDRVECVLAAGIGLFPPFVGYRLKRGEGLAGRVWESGEALAVDEYGSWPNALPAFAGSGLHAVAGVPLLSGREVVGVLGLAHVETGRRFGANEMALLGRFSRLASLAYENARLLSSAREELDQRRRAETALRDAEARYRLLVERLPAIVYDITLQATSREDIWRYVSPQIESILGYTQGEWIADGGRLFFERIHPDDLDGYLAEEARSRASGRPLAAEYRMRARDGHEAWIRDEAVIVDDGHGERSLQGVMYDVTERRELEGQLNRARTTEAVGRLAGGIAHDFNNLLTAISGYAQLLAGDLATDDPRRRDALAIEEASRRAAALTAQLLAFARRQVLQPTIVDLNSAVAETESLLGRLIGEHIRLVTRLGPGLGRVRADRAQLEQVIVNLAVNARDAMPEGGTLTIETVNANLRAAAARRIGVRPGRYVTLVVRDTGGGMAPEVRSRVFEPFFTTKRPGEGTGLGLATVFGIVEQGGGHIEAASAPGAGSTFTVFLPRADDRVERREAGEVPDRKAETGAIPAEPGAPRRTILVVEDEPAVRDLVCRTLVRSGYTVRQAVDGEEALRVVADQGETIDLVLTDLVMPVLGGRELGERLAAQRPGMKVLYMSGYTDDARVRDGIEGDPAAFIGKPFTPRSLIARVRAALEAGGPGDGSPGR